MDLDLTLNTEDLTHAGEGRFAEPPPKKTIEPVPHPAAPPASENKPEPTPAPPAPPAPSAPAPGTLTLNTLNVPRTGYVCDVPGCRKFGKKFSSQHALLQHRIARHGALAPATIPQSVEPTTTPTGETEMPKKYKCDECSREFNSAHGLNTHKRRAHAKGKEKPEAYECLECGVQLPTYGAMAGHISRAHKKGMIGTWKPAAEKKPMTAPTPRTERIAPRAADPHATHTILATGPSGSASMSGPLDFAFESASRLFAMGFTKVEIESIKMG